MSGLISFEFQIGAFSEGFDRVYLEDSTLYHEQPNHPDEPPQSLLVIEKVKLMEDQINFFWNKLNELQVWNWKKDYFDPDVMDGTEWRLKIIRPKKSQLKVEGQNAYPDNFDDFLKLLNSYIKEELYK